MFFAEARPTINRTASIPAPIGGINARDSLVAMAETDAIVLKNWWPQPYGCTVRKGYRKWATGLSGEVQTLAEWSNVDGNQKLFGWSTVNMYDITASGAVGAPLVAGLTNARWETVSVTNSAGSSLIAVNGIDNGIIYTSSGVARLVAGNGIVTNTWDGIDPANVAQVMVHQHRLWAVENDSSAGWFLPPDAVQGTFVKYDFGPLFSRGGYVAFLATWTMDDGNGAEDHLVVMSSQGEVVVFGGTDPTDDTKWTLVGVYYVGAPVAGRRGYTKAGGDLLLLTQQGVVSMTSMMVSTKVNEKENPLTSLKIQFLMSDLIAAYGSLGNWAIKYYPKYNMLVVNIPSIVRGGNIQLAANQITGAWTQFTGMDASSWGSYNASPYFGDYEGVVYLAWDSSVDNIDLDGTGGTSIVSEAQQAYTYFQSGSAQKQVGMYRPIFVVDIDIAFRSKVLYDFKTEIVSAPAPTPPGSSYLWGTALWGSGLWGGSTSVQKQWVQAEGMGVAASLLMVCQTQADTLWVATDYSLVLGQGLF